MNSPFTRLKSCIGHRVHTLLRILFQTCRSVAECLFLSVVEALLWRSELEALLRCSCCWVTWTQQNVSFSCLLVVETLNLWTLGSGVRSRAYVGSWHETCRKCFRERFYRRSFKSVKWAIFVQSEGPQADYSTKNDDLRKDSLQEYNSSVPWIEHEIITLLQKQDWEQEKRSERSCTEDVHTRTERRQTFPLKWEVYNLFRQQCQRSRSGYRYKEIEEGESSNSSESWAKCKVLNWLLRNAATNFGRQSLSHHYVPVSTLEESVVKVVKEKGEDNCSQDHLRLERTRCNTPKNWRVQEFRRFKHASGSRE